MNALPPQVERPEQYAFDRPALMESMLSLLLRLARVPSFVSKLASEPDLDLELLDQVLAQLEANHQAMLAQALAQVVGALEVAGARRQQRGGSSGAAAAAAAVTAADGSDAGALSPASKLRRHSEAKDVSDGTTADDGEGEGARETVALPGPTLGPQLECQSLPELPGAAPGSTELEQQYTAALEELSIGDFDSSLPRGYSRQFAEKANEAAGMYAPQMNGLYVLRNHPCVCCAGEAPAKVKRLTKEIKDLHSKTRLPCNAAASIFLRHDSDRMDKVGTTCGALACPPVRTTQSHCLHSPTLSNFFPLSLSPKGEG